MSVDRKALAKARRRILRILARAAAPLPVDQLWAQAADPEATVEAARILLRDRVLVPADDQWRLWPAARMSELTKPWRHGVSPSTQPPAGLATCMRCQKAAATVHVGAWNGAHPRRCPDGIRRPASCAKCVAPLPEKEVRALAHDQGAFLTALSGYRPGQPAQVFTRLALEVLELRAMLRKELSTQEHRAARLRTHLGLRAGWEGVE